MSYLITWTSLFGENLRVIETIEDVKKEITETIHRYNNVRVWKQIPVEVNVEIKIQEEESADELP